MFGRSLLRSFRSAWAARSATAGLRPTTGSNGHGRRGGTGAGASGRRGVAAEAFAGGALGLLARNPWTQRLVAGVVGGGAATAAATAWRWRDEQDDADDLSFETSGLAWVRELAGREGMREMLVPGQMLRRHPVGQLLTEDDHLFETMRRSEQVREFRCFFDPAARRFYSVVMLGRDVCGYPATVHGGLTAAIVDESFGGLYTALLTTGKLGATLPGLTARLELDYKQRVPAGTVLLVTAELESVEQSRKVWMRAVVSDGGKRVFAHGRALFVAPNLAKQVAGLLRWPAAAATAVAPAATA